MSEVSGGEVTDLSSPNVDHGGVAIRSSSLRHHSDDDWQK